MPSSVSAGPSLTLDLLVGFLAALIILLSQRPVQRLLSATRLAEFPAHLISRILGEVTGLLVLFVYLWQTGRQVGALFLGPLHWMDVTLVPIGLYLVGTIVFLAGQPIAIRFFPEVNRVSVANFALKARNGTEFSLTAGLAIAASFAEEYVFRAFLLPALALVLPVWAAAAVTILVFGLLHQRNWGWIGATAITLWAIPITLYVAYTGKLIPVMIAHAANDLITFNLLIPFLSRYRPRRP